MTDHNCQHEVPWTADPDQDEVLGIEHAGFTYADEVLIANAPADLAWLLARVDQLEKQAARTCPACVTVNDDGTEHHDRAGCYEYNCSGEPD